MEKFSIDQVIPFGGYNWYWFQRKDENNCKRIARLEANKGGIWWWWLRSPDRVNVKTVYIHGDGNIGIQGNNILKGNISDCKCTGGVRSAGKLLTIN